MGNAATALAAALLWAAPGAAAAAAGWEEPLPMKECSRMADGSPALLLAGGRLLDVEDLVSALWDRLGPFPADAADAGPAGVMNWLRGYRFEVSLPLDGGGGARARIDCLGWFLDDAVSLRCVEDGEELPDGPVVLPREEVHTIRCRPPGGIHRH